MPACLVLLSALASALAHPAEFPPTCPATYRKLAHRCLQKQPHNRLHASQVVQRVLEMLTLARADAAAAALTAESRGPNMGLAPLPCSTPVCEIVPYGPDGVTPLHVHGQQGLNGAALQAPRGWPPGAGQGPRGPDAV